METLSNDYRDVELLDLGSEQERQRGPFLVVQAGYTPGDEDVYESLFVLRPDGCWVDVNVYLSSGKPELLDEAVFTSAQQVMELLDNLPPEPKVAELPVSEEGLRAWLEAHPPGAMLEMARHWLAHYRERQQQRADGS